MFDFKACDEKTLIAQLNQLGESTGDYYHCYDFKTGNVTFSENTLEVFDVFEKGEPCCAFEKWITVMDPIDRARLKSLSQRLMAEPGQTYNLNYRVRNRYGQMIWVNTRGRSYAGSDGGPAYILGRVSAQFSSAREKSMSRNFHRDELKAELKQLRASGADGCLIMAGVDDLGLINIRSGWEIGDAVIQSLANGMMELLPGVKQIYRINSDRFAAVMRNVSEEQAVQTFGNLQEYMRGQCTISGGCVSLTRYDAPDEDMLITYVQTAIEAAKQAGKNRVNLFSSEDYEKKVKALELRDELKTAVDEGFRGFSLAYQAQVRSESYELFGAEALLRFESPRRGAVSPAEFVPVLEDSGLIDVVGMWVLRTALRQCREWRTYLPDFHISINMSYKQISSPSIEDAILEAVHESGVPGSALTLEITENMQLLNYPHLNDMIRAWKREGIEISVDDFGTGYSNLSRLRDMEIDEIKIDRCFVRDIETSAYNYRLIANMVELADSCQIRICCEGVETSAELMTLERLRPTTYQGFLFCRPTTPEKFTKCVSDWRSWVENCNVECDKCEDNVIDSGEARTNDTLCAKAILDAEDDIYYLSDVDTYEMYYLNRAGQKLFGVRDFQGRKCYEVLHGLDKPCEFCTNERIRRNSFYVWEHQNEYCDRRFLLKDKLLMYNGKQVRLEVAMDITKRERVSQATGERLNFANKIVGYLQTLSTQSDYATAVNKVLKSVGMYYQADRAYLFERNQQQPDHWDNKFEWCSGNVSSEIMNLQNVPPETLRRWTKLFDQDNAVMLYNLEPLKKMEPLEWQMLVSQGIYRMIAVPLREDGHLVGFLGVDNPRYSIHDDSQMRVLASFLVMRMRQDKNEQRYQFMLDRHNEDIFTSLSIGFWNISIANDGPRFAMHGDGMLHRMLDMPDADEDMDCMDELLAHVHVDDRSNVSDALKQMLCTSEPVTVSARWLSAHGELQMRMAGMCFEKDMDSLMIKGYCRLQ